MVKDTCNQGCDMGSEGRACDERSQNCLMINHKHDPSQIIPSFFKVMFGKNFSDLLILPPRFVKLNSLVDQETYLHNSSGQKWNVVVSTINGSLAFRKGWHEFTLDHGIELGDFLVFHYIKSSHFKVWIYDRSGCEKLNFSAESRHKNKRAKTTCDPVVLTPSRDSYLSTLPSESVQNPSRNVPNPSLKNDTKMSEITPRTGFSEDSYFMCNRDTSSAHEDDRSHLFDLSTFERPNIKASRVQLQMKGCSENGANKRQITDANSVDCSKRIKSLSNEDNLLPFASHTAVHDKKSLRAYMPEEPSGSPPKSDIPTASGGGMVDIKKSSKDVDRNPVVETSVNVHGCEAKSITSLPKAKINTAKVENFNQMVDMDEGVTIVKRERTDSGDNSLSLAVKVTCSVKPDSECSLELPEKLPIKVPKRGGDIEKTVVYLRDQVGRLWPVVYHQKNGVFVLTSGWKWYRKTSNIQPGDECTFVVEDINESVFGVQILRQ